MNKSPLANVAVAIDLLGLGPVLMASILLQLTVPSFTKSAWKMSFLAPPDPYPNPTRIALSLLTMKWYALFPGPVPA